MKRNIFLSIVCLLSLVALGSCSKLLEEPQKGVVAIETFYQTDEDAQGALVYMYDTMAQQLARAQGEGIFSYFFGLYEMPSDDIYGAGEFFGDNDQFGGQLNEFRFDTANPVVSGMYKSWYQIIYAANLIIDHFDGELADTPVKRQCLAEARAARAYAHMMLAIGWNRPPLVDHVLEGADRPTQYEGTHEELLEWCAREAEAAANDLAERASVNDKDGTARITKGMAWTTAGKAYLFAGNWNKAKENLKKVISSGKYALVPSDRIRETFHVAGEGNEEIIFATNVLPNNNIGDWNGRIQKTGWMQFDIWGWRNDHWADNALPGSLAVKGGWGLIGVREDFAKALIENDGFDSARRKAWILKYDPEVLYAPGYPSDNNYWVSKTIMVNGEEKPNPKYLPDRPKYIEKVNGKDTTFTNDVTKDIGRGIKSYTFGQGEYLHYKRVTDNADMDGWYSHMNTNVYRLAEVYLMYAEACARTSDNDGLQYLNAIQTRAESKTVSTSLTLDAVKKEKRFEMWMEGVRWPDMVRWSIQDGDTGIFESVKNNGRNIPSLYDAFWTKGEPTHRIYVEYEDCPSKQDVGFKAGKNEWFPYPFAETSINPEIGQNPGWGSAE